MEEIELRPLNVLIGPNGSGKSNFIEVLELLRAAPADLAGVVREGGGVTDWLWKGPETVGQLAVVSAACNVPGLRNPLRYRLEFGAAGQRLEVVDEAIEDAAKTRTGAEDVRFYYRFQRGRPLINARQASEPRQLQRDSLDPQQSVLSQRKDPDLYPELTALGRAFSAITTFREWSFGRRQVLRLAQPADLPGDSLLPDGRNLALVLNAIEHTDTAVRLNGMLKRFLPRFHHLSTRINGGMVQIFLHEGGVSAPIPSTRLSDGTMRFIALAAILMKPESVPLICIEEPELGMHPDAIGLLAELLVEASAKTQLVVTTHSDALLSALSDEVESVLVCENLRGSSSINRLSKDKLDFWLKQYRLGEIWRIGEIGGNP